MAEPLSLAELKQRADIVRDDIDDVLRSLITAGREWVESYTSLTINADSVTQRFDRFCSSMFLLVSPTDGQSVTVDYVSADDVPTQIIDARVLSMTRPARLITPAGAAWPDAATYVSVTVPVVPDTFKAAITLYVRAMHEDGSISAAHQSALEALCFPYRLALIG